VKEAIIKSLGERCVLMARAEGEVTANSPELGEEILHTWEGMNALEPDGFYLDDWYTELSEKYQVASDDVKQLFEAIRLLVCRYDELLDRVIEEV
jgi:hypothetical protein